MRPAKLLPFVPLLLALAGVAITHVLIEEHLAVFGGGLAEGLFCGRSGAFDCTRVASHASSWIFGVPLALVGQVFYIVSGGIALVGLAVRSEARRAIWTAGLAAVGAALVIDAWLAFVMVTQIGHVCLNCVVTYAVNLGLAVSFGALARGSASAGPSSDALAGASARGRRHAGAAAVVIAVVAVSWLTAASVLKQVADMRGFGEDELDSFLAEMRQKPALDPAYFAALPALGPANAPVTIVLVSDFECGFCRALAQEVETIRARAPQRYRVQFLNSPVDPACNPQAQDIGHPDACWLAQASHCARAQGKFWEYHRLVTETIPAPQVSRGAVLARLAEAGVERASFEACMNSDAPRHAVEAELALCRELGVDAAPSLVINGHVKNGSLYPWLLKRLFERLEELLTSN